MAGRFLAGMVLALTLLTLGIRPTVQAAPIVGEPGGSGVVIDCQIAPDGKTTCAVAKGQASVCARRAGESIRRSYRRFDYIPSPSGCTLDTAYWRDHGVDGPSPYDDTWDRLGSEGPRTTFFSSGRSYLEIFTSTETDNPYEQLARAFVVAELNRINRAALPEPVEAALDEAVALLLSQDSSLDPSMTERFRELAKTLDKFTAGLSGAGQCSTAVEPLTTKDIGKPIVGLVSSDQGQIQAVEPGDGQDDGILSIRPDGAGDHFLLADEDFEVAGIRKGKFTPTHNDCVTLDTGEQTVVDFGRIPGLPTITTTDFQDEARRLRIIIALNEELAPEDVEPAAGPGTPSGPTTPAISTPPSVTGAVPSFPSSTPLAITTASGGGGGAPVVIETFPSVTLPATPTAEPELVSMPFVIDLPLSQALSAITAVGLTVLQENINFASNFDQNPGGILLRTAVANVVIVVAQVPDASPPLVPPDTVVFLTVSQQVSDLPEPSSLSLFMVALLIIGLLLWWRKRDSSRRA